MEQFLALFNAPLQTVVTHFCWDAATNRPCCRSRAELVEKMTTVNSNLFLQRRPETPTAKEWTRIRMACCWCLLQLSRARLLPRGIEQAVGAMRQESPSDQPVLPHAVGSGENDMTLVSRARLDASLEFFRDDLTPVRLSIIVLTSAPTSSLLFSLI
eukprot:805092-Alexandrium_andersonii.AAC.1